MLAVAFDEWDVVSRSVMCVVFVAGLSDRGEESTGNGRDQQTLFQVIAVPSRANRQGGASRQAAPFGFESPALPEERVKVGMSLPSLWVLVLVRRHDDVVSVGKAFADLRFQCIQHDGNVVAGFDAALQKFFLG